MGTQAELYKQDFFAWPQTTAALIRAGCLEGSLRAGPWTCQRPNTLASGYLSRDLPVGARASSRYGLLARGIASGRSQPRCNPSATASGSATWHTLRQPSTCPTSY